MDLNLEIREYFLYFCWLFCVCVCVCVCMCVSMRVRVCFTWPRFNLWFWNVITQEKNVGRQYQFLRHSDNVSYCLLPLFSPHTLSPVSISHLFLFSLCMSLSLSLFHSLPLSHTQTHISLSLSLWEFCEPHRGSQNSLLIHIAGGVDENHMCLLTLLLSLSLFLSDLYERVTTKTFRGT